MYVCITERAKVRVKLSNSSCTLSVNCVLVIISNSRCVSTSNSICLIRAPVIDGCCLCSGDVPTTNSGCTQQTRIPQDAICNVPTKTCSGTTSFDCRSSYRGCQRVRSGTRTLTISEVPVVTAGQVRPEVADLLHGTWVNAGQCPRDHAENPLSLTR